MSDLLRLKGRLKKLEERLRPASWEESGSQEPLVLELENGKRVEVDRKTRMEVINFFRSLEIRANALIREQRERGILDPPPLTEEERKRKLREFIDSLKNRTGKSEKDSQEEIKK